MNQARLTEGSVARHLRQMAVPMMLGLLATMSFNVVDTWFVSKLGGDPLAAMSFTFPVVMVLTSIGIGLGAGTSSAVARAIGRGDHHLSQRLATDAMTLTFLLGGSVSALGWLTVDPLFSALGAHPRLLPLIHAYMDIWYFSAPLLMVPMVALASLRAMGLSQVQGYMMVAAALLNMLLDPLLIFGWGPFPRMEIAGAATATLIVRVFTFFGAIYYLAYKLNLLTNPLGKKQEVMYSWWEISRIGVPAMASNVIIPMAAGVVVWLVSREGTAAVAGLGIAVRLEPMLLIPFFALSAVIGPFCGQNLGAGFRDRVEQAITLVSLFCLGLGLLQALFLWLSGPWLARLFSDDPEVLAVAVSYFWIVPVSYGCYGMVMSINACFNGLGKPLPPTLISVSRVLLVYLPLALLGQWLWGVEGLFVASMLSNILLGGLAYVWLRSQVNELFTLPQPSQRPL